MNLFLKSGQLFPYVPYLTRRSVQVLRREWIKAIRDRKQKEVLSQGAKNTEQANQPDSGE